MTKQDDMGMQVFIENRNVMDVLQELIDLRNGLYFHQPDYFLSLVNLEEEMNENSIEQYERNSKSVDEEDGDDLDDILMGSQNKNTQKNELSQNKKTAMTTSTTTTPTPTPSSNNRIPFITKQEGNVISLALQLLQLLMNGNSSSSSSSPSSSHPMNLQNELVHKPVTMLPKLFLIHLMREIWNCDRIIRIGIIFILSGILLQLSSFAILFVFSLYTLPRIIITTSIIGVLSYLFFLNFDNPVHGLMQFILSKSHHNMFDVLFTCLESLNGIITRRILIGVFFILPTIIEMTAIIILSSFVSESLGNDDSLCSWMTGSGICFCLMTIELILLVPMYFTVQKINNDYNDGDGTIRQWTLMTPYTYRFGSILIQKRPNKTFSDCRIFTWIYLYSTALLATIVMFRMDEIHKTILLAAPFLIATGSFLIISFQGQHGEEDEDLFLNIVRRALRLSLADVLEKLGEDVAEDEMLRLSMLRWIVDYWARPSSATDAASAQQPASEGHRYSGADSPANVANSTRDERRRNSQASNRSYNSTQQRNNEDASSLRDARARNNQANSRDHNSTQQRNNDQGMDWNALNSMLNMTTNQMYSEASAEGDYPSQGHQQANQHHQDQPENQNRSVKNLRSMLSSLNNHEKAQHAVLAYKHAVNEFPPSRNTSITLAVARRCPAIISVTLLQLTGSSHAHYTTIILLPMMLLEAMRTLEWTYACHRAYSIEAPPVVSSEEKKKPFSPEMMEPMEILLSCDTFSPISRGASLQVWNNVKNSVTTLESGLTAMKCVDTANVATDIAFDVMSLVNIAVELKTKGLPHILGMLARDVMDFHSNESNDEGRGQYSRSVSRLVENSKKLSLNLGDIQEDGKNKDNFLHPVISGFEFLAGKGWLWGKDQNANNSEANKSNMNDDDLSSLFKHEGEDGIISGNHGPSDDQNEPNENTVSTKSEPIYSNGSTLKQDLELDNNDNNDNEDDDDDDDDKSSSDHGPSIYQNYLIENTVSTQSDPIHSGGPALKQDLELDNGDNINHSVQLFDQKNSNQDIITTESADTIHSEAHILERNTDLDIVSHKSNRAESQTMPTVETSCRNENSDESDEESWMVCDDKVSSLKVEEGNEMESISTENIVSHDTRQELHLENQNNSGLNLLGASLALVASAAVGAIALSAKTNDRERRKNKGNESTVTIERLDE